MKKNSKLKSILGKLVLCLVCALCCVTGKETIVYANWTCECSNPENADYDSKCWKCNKYRNMRPVFDTETDKEFDYGDTVKLSWTGKVGSQGYILAVRNLDTDYRPFYNMELGMYEDSYKITEDLPAGKYKAAVAAIDVYDKQYWCEECIYFYVNPEPVQEYVEITSTPVIDEGEEEWSFSWDTSDSDVIVVTPEEPELGVGGSTVGESESNYDSIYESLSDAGKAASGRFEQLLAGTATDSSEEEHTKSDLDVFELPVEDVITVTTANTTSNTDTSVSEETVSDEGNWYDWLLKWFTGDTTEEIVTEQPSVPVTEETVNEPVEDIDDTEYEEIDIEELIPAEFKIKSPKDGKIYKVGKNVTIKWKASERADKYEVRLINEDTGKKVKSVTTTAKSYKFKGNTLEEGNYSVSIKACNDYGAIECEALRFSVTKSGKSTFTVTSSKIKVTAGDAISADSPLKITMSSDVSSYSVTLVSDTIDKTLYSAKDCKDNVCELPEVYLYPGNDYTLTVVSKSGKNGKTTQTEKLSFKVALDYSKIGQEGKFQAPITKDSNCIITVNKNEYLGTCRDEYVKTLAGNIEYVISRAEANNAFTEVQVQCLRDIYRRQLDRMEGGKYVLLADNMDEYLEFRYEGCGKGSGTLENADAEGQADVSNRKANPDAGANVKFGTFSAMTIVIKNAEVQGVYMRTSTLPDNYLDYPGGNVDTAVVSAGVYELYRHNHDTFAAFQLRESKDNATIPAIYDEVTSPWVEDPKTENGSTITGCNIHHAYSDYETSRSSAGCLTVHKQDWAEYMAVYGWDIDENDYWNSFKGRPGYKNSSNDYWKSWTGSLNGQYVGQIVIERLIDIEINAHGKIFAQADTFPVTQE